MTDTAMSTDDRRATLTKALRKYRSDGYAIELSGDGLQATLTRKRRISFWPALLLSLVTAGLWLFVLLFQVLNRKTQSLVLYVDDSGKLHRA